jgi:hypothetical protein
MPELRYQYLKDKEQLSVELTGVIDGEDKLKHGSGEAAVDSSWCAVWNGEIAAAVVT